MRSLFLIDINNKLLTGLIKDKLDGVFEFYNYEDLNSSEIKELVNSGSYVIVFGSKKLLTHISSETSSKTNLKLIVYLSSLEGPHTAEVYHTGFNGYVSYQTPAHSLLDCIRNVQLGGFYVCLTVKNALSNQILKNNPDFLKLQSLTSRERQIVKEICQGRNANEIANEFNITAKTVEIHRHNILKKLNISSTLKLVSYLKNYDMSFN